MASHDLRDAPKCAFGTLTWRKYYWAYPRDIPAYENDYWGLVEDPDGNARDMHSDGEWARQVEDLKFVTDTIHALPAGRILDVGCGPGYLLSAINTNWEKHGVDVSARALESAARFATVQRGELPNLGYAGDHFDVVVMNHVIEHLRDPLLYIKACRSVLRPGGIFIVATPDFDSGCARRFGEHYRMLHDPGHISLFTGFSLVRMLEDFAFRVQEVEYPFFETRWFTEDSLLRMMDRTKVSPPFYGNHISVIAEKAG